MNAVGAGSATSLHASQLVKPQQATSESEVNSQAKPLKAEADKVTLSKEGKALLSELTSIEKGGKEADHPKTMGEKVESFTYGALGMEHPDKIKEEDDASYSAGQYLSAAATVGSLLLLLV